MLIIGISGKMGSGKTTLAKNLVEWLNKNHWAVHWKFADPLYKIQDAIADVMADCGRPIKVPDGNLLQLIGTEWGRTRLGQNVWADVMAARLEKFQASDSIICGGKKAVVIDDVRFPNEFDLLSKIGAILIRLDAPEETRMGRAEKWRDNTQHPSEIALDHVTDFDLFIDTKKEPADAALFLAINYIMEHS